MSKSDAFENALLLLIFNNTNIANIGDATGLRGASTVGSLYASLHTADPGETGTQATSETAYTGYARQAIARTTGGFTISGNVATVVANINFGTCTASAGAACTHMGIGVASSGATVLLYSGALSSSITITVGQPAIVASGSTITED